MKIEFKSEQEEQDFKDLVDFLRSYRVVYDNDKRFPVMHVFNLKSYTNTYGQRMGEVVELADLSNNELFLKILEGKDIIYVEEGKK